MSISKFLLIVACLGILKFACYSSEVKSPTTKINFDRIFPLSRFGKVYGLCMKIWAEADFAKGSNDNEDQNNNTLNSVLDLYSIIDRLILPSSSEKFILTDVESLVSALYNIQAIYESTPKCKSDEKICIKIIVKKTINKLEKFIDNVNKALQAKETEANCSPCF